MTNWISVKEKLPNHNQEVLATNGKTISICWADIGSHNYLFMINVHNQFTNITHWMPLPELPETNND